MVFKDVLPNGMRVVGEYMPTYRSVAMGVWIGAGSVYERNDESGAAHFIEHMLFKGTNNRTATQIAEEMDAIGGNLNAFTSKECTCFYGRALGAHMPKLADILSDLLCNSKLDEGDIEREKGVVCEEILMVEDAPDDLANELVCGEYYKGDPLSRPILGTQKSVRGFTQKDLKKYMQRLYQPDNMVISVAGNFEREVLLKTVMDAFTINGSAVNNDVNYGNHSKGLRIRFEDKDVEQTHICISLPGYAADSPESYSLLLLNNVIGGSMSSHLFQSVREEKGLAYSVYSYPSSYKTSGYFTLYAGTSAENARTVTALLLDEVRRVGKKGITAEELQRGKDQLISGFMLGQESTSTRSSSIGRAELVRGSHLTEDEIINRVNAVNMEDIESVLPHVCELSDISAAIVGRCAGHETEIEQILRGEQA